MATLIVSLARSVCDPRSVPARTSRWEKSCPPPAVGQLATHVRPPSLTQQRPRVLVGPLPLLVFMPRKPRKPPSQTWRTFLDNHVGSLASIDFFTVPTATFRVLYVFFVLAHDRRRVLHFNVTEHPSATWTAQQIVEAFPEDTAPRFMIRDRDCIFGDQFRRRVQGLGIEEILTAPRSPWQNPYAERLVGSVRRECLDHVIVLGERHLGGILKSYFAYYHGSRTHLSLRKETPVLRKTHPPAMGRSAAAVMRPDAEAADVVPAGGYVL